MRSRQLSICSQSSGSCRRSLVERQNDTYTENTMSVTWTAIGMLGATLLGMFALLASFQSNLATFQSNIGARIDGLSARIEEQGRSLSARIEEQGRSLGARIDGLSARIDEQAARIDGLAVSLSSHIQRHAG